MSFGFGVGDFITVIQLANKVRKRFVDAPEQLRAISDEVKSLSNILRDIEDVYPERDYTSQQVSDLQDIFLGCRKVLTDLDEVLDEYQNLEARKPVGLGRKSKRLWKRLKWEPEDIKDLRSRLASNITLLTAFNSRILLDLSYATSKGVERLTTRQGQQEDQEILDWLSPINSLAQQSDLLKGCQEGTGQWFLESQQYQQWFIGQEPTLFCPGIPGAGKTLLTSIVIDDIQGRCKGHSDVAIAFVYFSYKRPTDQTIESVLASLLKQMLLGCFDIPSVVRKLYEDHRTKIKRPNTAELLNTLDVVLKIFPRSFILLDALDECTGSRVRSILIENVHALKQNYNVCHFATSRFIPEILAEYSGSATLEIRANDDDVRRYLQDRMMSFTKCIQRNKFLQDQVVSQISCAVGGMFLLARLHLESLSDKTSVKAVKVALEKLPRGSEALSLAYEEALERIEAQKSGFASLAKEALSWLVCAKSELKIEELRHALAVEDCTSKLDHDNLPEADDILSSCAGLVILDEQTSTVRLVHYTTQKYLESILSRWAPYAHEVITKTCLTYLAFEDILTSCMRLTTKSCYRFVNLLDHLPLDQALVRYGACNWASHAKQCWNEVIEERVLMFLKDPHQASSCLAMVPQYRDLVVTLDGRDATALHASAFFGLEEATIQLLVEGSSPDAKDGEGNTPLHYAMIPHSGTSNREQEVIVKLLLARDDVNPNAVNEGFWTPLHFAALYGREDMTRLLMAQSNIDLKSPDRLFGRTALYVAVQHGHESVVRLLLEKDDTQIHLRDKGGNTILLCAVKSGHGDLVEYLLQREDIEINSQDKNGNTALIEAAFVGDEAIVGRLLERGDLQVNLTTEKGATAWSTAADYGHEAIVALLLQRKDTLLKWRGYDYRTALVEAVMHKHREVVKLLVRNKERYIDYRDQDQNDLTALMLAYAQGSKDIVDLLKEAGAPGEIPRPHDLNYRRISSNESVHEIEGYASEVEENASHDNQAIYTESDGVITATATRK